MSSTSAGPAGLSNSSTTAERPTPSASGHFILTLCRLPGPMSIRPPQSPQLKAFTFFTSRARREDGKEHFYLHMGYFDTLADAEKWVANVSSRFPNAFATIAPTAGLTPRAATPVEDRSLSDTQVLRILETRSGVRGGDGVDEKECDQIDLLRPEDTGTRHAVREAVASGAPVLFAVQLLWSAQPIDLGRVPSLAVFNAYTLYATESRREGRSRYFLRLGFFGDPLYAKQLAVEVRSKFAAAAVVPVSDQEVARAREAAKDKASIPSLVQQEINRAPDSNITPEPPVAPEPVSDKHRRPLLDDRKLELALKRLARREMWTNSDVLSDSGIRHLKVNVKVEANRRSSGRSTDVSK
jgi:hypothetical protein